jgi:hypothetical protein
MNNYTSYQIRTKIENLDNKRDNLFKALKTRIIKLSKLYPMVSFTVLNVVYHGEDSYLKLDPSNFNDIKPDVLLTPKDLDGMWEGYLLNALETYENYVSDKSSQIRLDI